MPHSSSNPLGPVTRHSFRRTGDRITRINNKDVRSDRYPKDTVAKIQALKTDIATSGADIGCSRYPVQGSVAYRGPGASIEGPSVNGMYIQPSQQARPRPRSTHLAAFAAPDNYYHEYYYGNSTALHLLQDPAYAESIRRHRRSRRGCGERSGLPNDPRAWWDQQLQQVYCDGMGADGRRRQNVFRGAVRSPVDVEQQRQREQRARLQRETRDALETAHLIVRLDMADEAAQLAREAQQAADVAEVAEPTAALNPSVLDENEDYSFVNYVPYASL